MFTVFHLSIMTNGCCHERWIGDDTAGSNAEGTNAANEGGLCLLYEYIVKASDVCEFKQFFLLHPYGLSSMCLKF